jgi:hypothetical protein
MHGILQALPTSFGETKADPAYMAAAVFAAWEKAAGEKLAEQTDARSFDDGVLTVAVPDGVWRSNLEMLAPHILSQLNRFSASIKVKRINFVIDEKPFPKAVETKQMPVFEPNDEIRSAAATIEDPELRKRFEDAVAAYLGIKGNI